MSLTSYQTAPPRVLKIDIMLIELGNANANSASCAARTLESCLSVPEQASGEDYGGSILVGTASWSDPGFVEHWYPKKMPASERLAWYAEQFEMVEVNSTFYAVPDLRMAERWCRSTPDGFIFDVKLHQLLSRHATAAKLLPPRLQERAETDLKGKVKLTPGIEEAMIREFLGPVEVLRAAGKLGALLLQLSPAFSPRKHELGDLQNLLSALQPYRVAIELRNRNWAEGRQLETTLAFLRKRAATLVSVDSPATNHFTIMPHDLDEVTTSELAYLRLHGRDAKAYTTGKTVAARFNYDYDDEEIAEVATRSKKLSGKAKEVHVVFNNNALDYAPHAALRMRAALKQIAQAPLRQPTLL
ncbi:MAG: DUF72 domain-containing protein [Verrucomicrobiota bacterium]|nr:DUF72 domain-containing protein [Verrucomicrobiota bacterium]